MKSNILKQIEDLTTLSQPNTFTLCTEADVAYVDSAGAAAVCESYGTVYAPDSPVASKCVATGKGTEEAVVGEMATAALEFVTFSCSESISTLMSFQVELVSEITGGKVLGSVERNMEQRGQGQYVISYQPTVKGRHQLHIKADGQHIRGSLYHVIATLPVENLGSPILTLSEVVYPWAVAISGEGEIIVARCGANRINVFSRCGSNILSFGNCGLSNGEMMHLSDITVDREGNLLLLEWSFSHRIQTNGNFLEAVGSKGSGPLQFNNPAGITYSAKNNKVYVTDSWNHRVQVLTSDLTFVTMFGEEGSGEAQFFYPHGVTTNNTGKVYVADCGNHCIQIFMADGGFLRMFGSKGEDLGELCGPWGVGVDASGFFVYVSESRNHRVSVFTSEGRFVTAFGCKGTAPEQFDSPRGLAVDENGVVYVCDTPNNRVKMY